MRAEDEDMFNEIAMDAIHFAEQVDCSFEDFQQGLTRIITIIIQRQVSAAKGPDDRTMEQTG